MNEANNARGIAKSAPDGADVKLLRNLNTETYRALVSSETGPDRVEFYEDNAPDEVGGLALAGYWVSMDAAHVVDLEEMA